MKTSVLLLTACFLVVSAQTGRAQSLQFGVVGGIDLATEKFDNAPPDINISHRVGPMLGLQADYWFAGSWGLSLQALYDQKGAHADEESSNRMFVGQSSADWNISYFEIPLRLKFRIGSGVVRPYLFAGPSVGFLLSNTQTVHLQGTTIIPYGIGGAYSNDTTVSLTDSTAKVDFSIVAGIGCSFTISPWAECFIEAGQALGLTNIDLYSSDMSHDQYVYSRDIRITAGVMLAIN